MSTSKDATMRDPIETEALLHTLGNGALLSCQRRPPLVARLHGGVKALWRRITGVSIHIKLLGVVFVVVLLMATGMILTTHQRLLDNLGQELEMRGIAIARDLRDDAELLILTQNIFGLYQKLRSSLENNPDVRYVFVLDQNGQVLAHSFPAGVPNDLIPLNRLADGQAWSIQEFRSDEGNLTDVSMPILGGRLGSVRVGLTHQRLEAMAVSTTQELLLVTAAALGIGALLSLWLTSIFTAPIITLVEAARAVGQGDLTVQTPVRMTDEIGELTAAFNTMTRNLNGSRSTLVTQNRTLTALNAISTAISSSHDLQEMLDRVLITACEALAAPAGWILLDMPETAPQIVSHWGLSAAFLAQETRSDLPACHCHSVLRQLEDWRQPVMRTACPRLERARSAEHPEARFTCHLSAPLIAYDLPLGVLNIVAEAPSWFDAKQVDLIGAIARQVGVAVDAEQQRRRALDELRHREQLRQQLLARIMAVQEEERRRIARELHDQAGQSLTLLLVKLRLLEEQVDIPALRQQVADLKILTNTVMDELHRLAIDLRPASLDHVGLAPAVEQMLMQMEQAHGVAVQMESIGMQTVVLPMTVEIHLYRIIQEALTNAIRHGQAHQIDVVLEARDNKIIIVVEDDGNGFIPDHAASTTHLGLIGMQERVTQINGHLTIESAPGAGTTIIVEAPR